MPHDALPVSELRHLVRDVLREAVARRGGETVSIANDAELQAFVRLLISRLDDPKTAAAIREGKHHFRLATPSAAPLHAPAPKAAAVAGLITERTVEHHAKSGTIMLGEGAIMTPLARDKARRLGLKVERMS
jgi:hypothetical protein